MKTVPAINQKTSAEYWAKKLQGINPIILGLLVAEAVLLANLAMMRFIIG